MTDFLMKDSDLKLNPSSRPSPTRGEVEIQDFVLTGNLLEEVEQALRIELKTLQGEWFLDEQVGIPYFTEILGQKPHKLTLLGIFREAILKVKGVAELTQIDVKYDAHCRAVTVDFEVKLTDGSRMKLYV